MKGSWWVDFRFNHTRYRKRSPENSRAGALAYEATLRQKLTRGETISAIMQGTKHLTFEAFAGRWFDEYVRSNNKYSEQRTKQTILSSSLIPFFGRMPIASITTRHVEQYKAHALAQGASRKTVNNRLVVLRKCVYTAYEWLELDGKSPKIEWLKASSCRTEFLSPDECGLLLAHAGGLVRDMILTALRTGMRQGELTGLQWSSIDWQNRSIAVRHSRCDYSGKLMSTKSNRERHIPIDVDVHAALFARKKETGYVFVDEKGLPFDSQTLSRRLTRVCEAAGLRRITWHVLRHTFASHLAARGVPMTAIQMLMGHSTITTTMRYAHLAPSTLRAAIDLLNPNTALAADFGQPVGNPWLEAQQQEITGSTSAPENL